MATNHVAIMRSSARMAQQQQLHQQQEKDSECNEDSSLADKKPKPSTSHHHHQVDGSNLNDISTHLSVISMSSSEGDDVCHESNHRKLSSNKQPQVKMITRPKLTRPIIGSLDEIINVSQIDKFVDPELSEAIVIDRLLNKWREITSNLDTVVNHLNKCSDQVTSASICCLETLVDSVDATCDKVDEHVKAFHKLMAKCDELGTKISVAGSFCDEIKTLKKSVDTLENLYKTRPQKPIVSQGTQN